MGDPRPPEGAPPAPAAPRLRKARWATPLLVAVMALAIGASWFAYQSRHGKLHGRIAMPPGYSMGPEDTLYIGFDALASTTTVAPTEDLPIRCYGSSLKNPAVESIGSNLQWIPMEGWTYHFNNRELPKGKFVLYARRNSELSVWRFVGAGARFFDQRQDLAILEDKIGSLLVKVSRDGRPAPDARVTLFPLDANDEPLTITLWARDVLSKNVDKNGDAEFRDIYISKYKAVAYRQYRKEDGFGPPELTASKTVEPTRGQAKHFHLDLPAK